MKIKNFNHIISATDFDIIHEERTLIDEVLTQSSEVFIEHNGTVTRVKFLTTKGNEIQEDDFLLIPETNILFYRGIIEWCAFDLRRKIIVRRENATQLPFIERIGNTVIIHDELSAESTDLKANLIDKVPIDPPSESVEYEDRIEFDSPVFGKQTLKLSPNNNT